MYTHTQSHMQWCTHTNKGTSHKVLMGLNVDTASFSSYISSAIKFVKFSIDKLCNQPQTWHNMHIIIKVPVVHVWVRSSIMETQITQHALKVTNRLVLEILKLDTRSSEPRSCVKPGLPVYNSPYGLCGQKAVLNSTLDTPMYSKTSQQKDTKLSKVGHTHRLFTWRTETCWQSQ